MAAAGQEQGHERVDELRREGRVALQQAERHGAAQRIDDEIDIGIGTKLPTLDRAPQDGRISLTLTGRAVDFRVASQATSHGENVVLRILDRQKGIVPLDKLAGDPVDIYVNGRLIARGEVLVLNDNFCVRVAELISGEAAA